jgi:hypothetical protein
MMMKKLLGSKSRLTKLIKDDLRVLDYEKRLRIKECPLPMLFFVKPAEEGRPRAKNPTFYLINTGREYHGPCPLKTLAVMAATRAVCCRRSIEKKGVEIFSGDIEVSADFNGMCGALDAEAFFPEETDAEIRARIAGNMYENGIPLDETAWMILTDASEVVKKYGVPFLEDSMYILI